MLSKRDAICSRAATFRRIASLFDAEEVARHTRRNLEENDGILAALGRSDDAVAGHLAAAERGNSFLVIYAPGDLDTERAMNVVRRVPFEFVHRYHRLAIEILV